MAPFYGLGSIASRLQSHYEETIYFFNAKTLGIPGTPRKQVFMLHGYR